MTNDSPTIQPTQNSNRTTSLKEAAEYARRGSNSAILKRIDYYCDHPLVNGNVLVELKQKLSPNVA